MKKSLLALLVILLFAPIASALDFPPICVQGEASYYSHSDFIVDFCEKELKAKTYTECQDKVIEQKITQYQLDQRLIEFAEKVQIEVCGK